MGLIYRLDKTVDIERGCAVPVCVAKFDYAGQHDVFGNRIDKSFYTDLVEDVIMNEPPASDQIVHGADVDGLCCVTITGQEYPSRIAISMLEDLYTNVHFSIKYGDKTFSKKSHVKRVRNILRDSVKNMLILQLLIKQHMCWNKLIW